MPATPLSATPARARITLDHIAIAAPRLGETAATLERLFGSRASSPEEVAAEKVRLAFLAAGDARLEVLEPTSPESPVARFLERGRAGVHHLSFRVEGVSLDEWLRDLQARGVEIIGEGIRDGAEGVRVFFVHPRSAGGLLVEFSQREGARP